tara:strand:- start:178 stop:1245 length:1068 start_codon:yes stop_codon:yes gene_type:complete
MIQKIDKNIFAKSILTWYKENKRELPWRKTKDPYKIWISEIILQQTRVKQGIHYYNNFIKTFPDVESLSKSEKKDVLKIWEGLGYYSRAINILDNAKKIGKTKNFPNNFEELLKLKGVGEYTASAISSICFNEKKGVVDGNVFRLFSRIFDINTPINTNEGKRKFTELANMLVPPKKTGDYNQALMDYGATQCKHQNPKCETCIFKKYCKSLRLGIIHKRPVKKTRNSKIKHRILNYFLIKKESNIYIQKRKENIWKDLYELPLFESEKMIDKKYILDNEILKKLGINMRPLNIFLSNTMTHNLSHQKLDIFFWKVNAINISAKRGSGLKKISKKKISNYPFPKPIKIYLHELLT